MYKKICNRCGAEISLDENDELLIYLLNKDTDKEEALHFCRRCADKLRTVLEEEFRKEE